MSARDKLLDAAVAIVRTQGLHATTVDDLCAAAGVTKGAFFHHFASKEALAVAAAHHWGTTTGALFAAAAYHGHPDPAERVFGYLDLRATMVSDNPAEFTCLVGTMVQEAFATAPDVREACAAAIFDHAATLETDLSAALGALVEPPAGVTARSLAVHTQTVLQGAFIMAKAANDPTILLDSIEHLRRYLRCVLQPRPDQGATSDE